MAYVSEEKRREEISSCDGSGGSGDGQQREGEGAHRGDPGAGENTPRSEVTHSTHTRQGQRSLIAHTPGKVRGHS